MKNIAVVDKSLCHGDSGGRRNEQESQNKVRREGHCSLGRARSSGGAEGGMREFDVLGMWIQT